MDDQTKVAPDDTQPVNVISGGIHKEYEKPLPSDSKIIEDVQEFEVPREVASHVQVQTNKPDIPPDLKNIGVTHAPSDQAVSDVTTITNQVPLTDDQINTGLTRSPLESIRWLAEWCIKQLKLAHVQLAKVKGRYIRVSNH